MKKWIKYLLLSGIFCLFQSVFADERFIALADIHFDPFNECKLQSPTCPILNKLEDQPIAAWPAIFEKYAKHRKQQHWQNTNYFLLKEIVMRLNDVCVKERPDFVLVLGDFLAHRFQQKYKKYSAYKSKLAYEAFVKKVFKFLMVQLNASFPAIDVFSAIGNNDSYSGNYTVQPHGKFLTDIAAIWSKAIKTPFNLKSFDKDFAKAGYYEVANPHDAQEKILILNTVIFSAKTKGLEKAADLQLRWLKERLEAAIASHQKVIIAFHIPMGLSKLDFAQWVLGSAWKFWRIDYQMKFLKIMEDYTQLVTAILVAHVHREDIGIFLQRKIKQVPIFIVPSVSPIMGNNPSFKIFKFDANTLTIQKTITCEYPLDASKQNCTSNVIN